DQRRYVLCRPEQAQAAGDVEKRFIEREAFHQRCYPAEYGKHLVRNRLVPGHAHRDANQVRAAPLGFPHRHRGAYAKFPCLVACCGHDSAYVAAHHNRLAAQFRPVPLLHGRVKGIHVDMQYLSMPRCLLVLAARCHRTLSMINRASRRSVPQSRPTPSSDERASSSRPLHRAFASSRPNNAGQFALRRNWSAPAFFPITSVSPSTSRIACFIWSAEPMLRAKQSSDGRLCTDRSVARQHAEMTHACMSAPVFTASICSSSARDSDVPSDDRSIDWPPVMPREPQALASS